jgi:hypothetical protein
MRKTERQNGSTFVLKFGTLLRKGYVFNDAIFE